MGSDQDTPTEAGKKDSSSEDLQFEHAEYVNEEQPAVQCADCGNKIDDTYFQRGEDILCSSCRWAAAGPVEAEGSGSGHYLRAGVYGSLAAAAGTAIYFGIVWVTNYELSLIAILVGWMVGRAVLVGSGNRGGRAFQVMAVVLTYCAIVMSYAPFIIQGMVTQEEQAEGAIIGAGEIEAGGPAAPLSAEGETAEEGRATRADPSQEEPPTTVGDYALAALLLFGLVLASPFLAGFDNIIGLIIIGIGLYQAWVGARSQQLDIAGPFSMGNETDAAAKAEGA